MIPMLLEPEHKYCRVSVPSRLAEVLSFYLSPVREDISCGFHLFCELLKFGGEEMISTKFWVSHNHQSQ